MAASQGDDKSAALFQRGTANARRGQAFRALDRTKFLFSLYILLSIPFLLFGFYLIGL
jgi:hypothetical protein